MKRPVQAVRTTMEALGRMFQLSPSRRAMPGQPGKVMEDWWETARTVTESVRALAVTTQ